MQKYNKLLQILSFNLQDKYDFEILSKIILINIYSAIGLLYATVFCIISVIVGEMLYTIISAIIIVSTIIIFFYLKHSKNHDFAAKTLVGVYSVFLLFLLIDGGLSQAGTMWFFIYPALTIFILGINQGLFLNSAMLVLMIAIFALPDSMLLNISSKEFSYNIFFKIISVTTYLAVFLMTYAYKYLRNDFQQQLEKNMLEAQRAYKEKNEFISKLSHQIRTPLNNILGILSFLSKTELELRQQDFIETIQASANNLVSVVNSIDEVSQVEINNSYGDNLSFNLYLTINSTISLFTNQLGNNIRIDFIHDSNIPERLIGNPVKIKQVFLNLIEYLIKNNRISNESINIEISTIVGKENNTGISCLFEVKSDKMQSNPEDIDNQTDKKGSIDFSELDLSITRKLIISSGGKLKIQHKSGKTIFAFSLDLKKTERNTIEKKSVFENINPLKTVDNKSVALKDANILLVEDNAINQKIVVLSISKLVNSIDIAENGKVALDKFGKTRYDLILMDVQMPVMDGIKTTVKLREIEASTNTHTPIIAMTANALLGDKEDCLAAGMDDYIAKPFKLEYLISRIEYHLSKSDNLKG